MASEKSLQSVEGEEAKECPECGSKDIVREDNEVYCKKCGYVFD